MKHEFLNWKDVARCDEYDDKGELTYLDLLEELPYRKGYLVRHTVEHHGVRTQQLVYVPK